MKLAMTHRPLIFCSILSMLALSACTPLGIATGAAAGVGTAASQEGGLSSAASDAGIKARINDAWLKYDIDTFSKLSTTVDQGRVLLTGVVQNPEARVEAVRLVWQVPEVKQVINEIQVANSEGFPGFIRDGWITTRLRAAITFEKNIQSLNYSIDTVQGVVYLMGVAMNQAELDRVMQIARTIPNVKQVVSYVKMIGEPVQATGVAQ
jgi:osmotically-inducible protein OsmY